MPARRLFSTAAWPWIRARRTALWTLFLGVLAPCCLFGLLAAQLAGHEAIARDRALLLLARAQAGPALDRAMLLASHLGSAWVPATLSTALALGLRRRWRDQVFWLLAIGGSYLLNLAAKQFFQRTRPELWLPLAPEPSYSFPSGHAMQSMSLAAAALVLLWPTRWRWAGLAAGLPFVAGVGLSRLYLGVHFPSDVLAGWLAALAWVLGLKLLLRRGGAAAPGGR